MAAQQLVFQTNYELNMILQDWITEELINDPLIGPAGLFPLDTTEYAQIQWVQMDNYWGLSSLRGLEGQPGRVQMPGVGTYQMDPGYYGDVANISEAEMTKWRKPGTYNEPWNVESLIAIRQKQLLLIALQRLRQVVWALLATGTFSVASPDGVKHTDTFPIQTTATVHPWSATSTATPLADFRATMLLHRGHSVRFDSSAQAWMNQKTFNYLASNVNGADIYGRRTTGLGTFEGLGQINELLTKDNLPNIVIYDEGYQPTANPGNLNAVPFTAFIPDNQVIVVGKRPGNAPVGKAQFTRNASLLGAVNGKEDDVLMDSPYAGFAMKLIDKGEIMAVGRELELGLGFNWGPTIEYPSAIVSMNVGAGS